MPEQLKWAASADQQWKSCTCFSLRRRSSIRRFEATLKLVGISAPGSGPAQHFAPPIKVGFPSNPDLFRRHRSRGPRELDLMSESRGPVTASVASGPSFGPLSFHDQFAAVATIFAHREQLGNKNLHAFVDNEAASAASTKGPSKSNAASIPV